MYDEKLFASLKGIPFILEKDGIINLISEQFTDMTEYTCDELLNSDIGSLFETLKVCPNININNIDEQVDYFLFTKSFEPRIINIKIIQYKQEKIYTFLEKSNFSLKDKFPFLNILYSDNYHGISIYSIPDSILLKANEKSRSFLESPYNKKENCIGKHISEFLTGFKGSSFESIWNEVIKAEKPYNIDEYMYEGFARGLTYWRVSLVPIMENNKSKYCIVMAIDITEQVLNRKRVEEQAKVIERQKKELEAVLDNMIDGFSIIDKDRTVIKVNKAVERWSKCNRLHKIGDISKQVKFCSLSGRELKKDELPGSLILKGKKVEKFEFLLRINGTERCLSASGRPIYDENGNFIMGVLNTRDITSKIRRHRLISEQKDYLEAIIKSMSDGLELVDNKYKITFLNQSAKSFFYNPEAEVNARDSLKFNKCYYGIDGEEILQKDLPAFKVINEGSFQNYILTIDRPDKKIYASVNGSPIYNKEGKVESAILCIRDITQQVMQDKELKQHQQALLQSEREKNETLKRSIEMKDEFLSLMSHEFRTPLNVINTAIQALTYIYGNRLPDKVKEYIATIRQNTFRQLRLVNNLLDITRANAGSIKINKKNIDIVFLTKAITESVYDYASTKGVTITFKSSFKKKIVAVDDEKYERIILNLLSNAIKFTPEGENITVSLQSSKGTIHIYVKDSGIGIPPDKVDLIFERFGQVDSSLSRQAEGTGIGLSLVKKLVEALEGSISVKSKIGIGSTFTVVLPNKTIVEEPNEREMIDLLDNRLVQTTKVEFSDIYL